MVDALRLHCRRGDLALVVRSTAFDVCARVGRGESVTFRPIVHLVDRRHITAVVALTPEEHASLDATRQVLNFRSVATFLGAIAVRVALMLEPTVAYELWPEDD